MMPRGASLSDNCAPDCCRFFSLGSMQADKFGFPLSPRRLQEWRELQWRLQKWRELQWMLYNGGNSLNSTNVEIGGPPFPSLVEMEDE